METESDWTQARELFLDLVDLPEDERLDALRGLEGERPALAARVRRLLRHDRGRAEGFGAARPGEQEAARQFGPYEVIRPIGRGGMGEVFVARRADGEYEKEVAIKLLRGDSVNRELVARFLRERQTLARLDHEYIARLLDGGSTASGEPYLVMEYVEGEPANVFAARLDLAERIRLFIRIGQAVAHAHERGFVHRDLKPSNILVRSDGSPRLLDFGIARPDPTAQVALEHEDPLTRTGQRVFTPEYASPEQVRGEIATTRSDVFALGVLLYVFLCDETPWGAVKSLHELERVICDTDPIPPSRRTQGTTRNRLAGDLDAVVLQCLSKRPERRYETVAALCRDLECHLEGRPIQARRTGALTRTIRFLRRNPAYAFAITLSVLAAGAIWFAWDAQRRGQRNREELKAAVADRIGAAQMKLSDGSFGVFDAADEELDAALVALRELPDEPELEADVLVQKAVVANLRRDWDAGLALLDQVEERLGSIDAPAPRVMATYLNARAYALHRKASDTPPNDPLRTESREASRVALEYAREHLPADEILHLDAVLGWADELRGSGDVAGALLALEEAVETARDQDPSGETLSRLLNEKAGALTRVQRLAEAAEAYAEALEVLSLHRGERHPGFATVRLNLGITLFRLGRLEEAKSEFELSLATGKHLELDSLISSNQHFLGRIHCEQGDFETAEAFARDAITIREQTDSPFHANRSRCLLGIVQAHRGLSEQARMTLTPILDNSTPGSLQPKMEAEACLMLGSILRQDDEETAARRYLSRALGLKRELLGASHQECIDLERWIAE